MAGEPDPKPPRRRRKQIRQKSPKALAAVALRADGCQAARLPLLLSPRCGKPTGSLHHVVPKGAPHFGDDTEDNLLALCGHGTAGHHGGWHNGGHAERRLVGLGLGRPHLLYVFRKLGGEERGRAWLERRYGLSPAEVDARLLEPTQISIPCENASPSTQEVPA